MIAIRSLQWGGNLNENDLMTTNGGMNALSFCLMAWENPETPLLLKALVIREFSAGQRPGTKSSGITYPSYYRNRN
jgi:hypothetical protein